MSASILNTKCGAGIEATTAQGHMSLLVGWSQKASRSNGMWLAPEEWGRCGMSRDSGAEHLRVLLVFKRANPQTRL